MSTDDHAPSPLPELVPVVGGDAAAEHYTLAGASPGWAPDASPRVTSPSPSRSAAAPPPSVRATLEARLAEAAATALPPGNVGPGADPGLGDLPRPPPGTPQAAWPKTKVTVPGVVVPPPSAAAAAHVWLDEPDGAAVPALTEPAVRAIAALRDVAAVLYAPSSPDAWAAAAASGAAFPTVPGAVTRREHPLSPSFGLSEITNSASWVTAVHDMAAFMTVIMKAVSPAMLRRHTALLAACKELRVVVYEVSSAADEAEEVVEVPDCAVSRALADLIVVPPKSAAAAAPVAAGAHDPALAAATAAFVAGQDAHDARAE